MPGVMRQTALLAIAAKHCFPNNIHLSYAIGYRSSTATPSRPLLICKCTIWQVSLMAYLRVT